jgi:hypothetical protein
MKLLVCGTHHEGDFVLGLDDWDEFVGYSSRDCRREWPPLSADQLIGIAAELRATALVLVTFVEDDRLAPTEADIARFEGLRLECADEGICLLDQLLMSGHRWRSVREVSAGCDASTSW